MSHESRELALCTYNDGDLYRARTQFIVKGLRDKYRKGVFNRELAIKAMIYVTTEEAKKYCRQFCESGARYYNIFDAKARREAAEEVLDYYMEHVTEEEGGNDE